MAAAEPQLLAGGEFLVQELNRRTQVDPFPDGGFRMLTAELEDVPPFLWIAVGAGARIDQALSEKLERFMASGGTVFAEPDGSAVALEKLRNLAGRLFRDQAPKPLSEGDLPARTFYFLSPASMEKLRIKKAAGRLVWIDSSVPVLKALAEHGKESSEMGEEAIRASINIVMYTLTGSYKDDLTHVRYLLRRRKF